MAMKCPVTGRSTETVSVEVAAVKLAEALKGGTTEAHLRAEHHPVQAAMVKGGLSLAEYRRVVLEMSRVYDAVWLGVDWLRRSPRFAALGTQLSDRKSVFAADLAALDAKLGSAAPASETLPASAKVRAETEQAIEYGRGFLIVGAAYVLEGSTNGGLFISRAVEKSLGLTPGAGTRWLNPYGEAVRSRWQETRGLLDGLGGSQPEAAEAVAAANRMFLNIEAVLGELAPLLKRTELE